MHSKPFAVRARPGPPLLGPKPYRKGSGTTWRPQESPSSSTPGQTPLEGKQELSQIEKISALRGEKEETPRKSPKSPQIVRFGSAEVFGLEPSDSCDEDEEEALGINKSESRRKLSFADDRESSATTEHWTKSLPGLSTAQAVRDCEEYTDWANEVLSQNNLPLISDLRTSIGDGYTLPTILEIIGGVSLSCVKTNPASKEERVSNILHCLKFLCKRGVDITGIQPAEIEDGNLKAVLTLVGNIRQHFKKTYLPEQNGCAHSVTDSPIVISKPPPAVRPVMPGAMKLPGAVPTPFVPQGSRNNLAESGGKMSSHQDDHILPGVLGMEVNNLDINRQHHHIISTTEIGMNGVAQHGVDERKQHLANNSKMPGGSNRGMVIRHPNARSTTPGVREGGPPSVTQRAWTGSPRPQPNHVNGKAMSPSVEDRLKNLLGSNSSHSGSQDNIPSKPSDRVQGSRAEVIISRPPSAVAFRKPGPSRATSQNLPGLAGGASQENSPYPPRRTPNDFGSRGVNNHTPDLAYKNQSPAKSGGFNDLRDACHKLYGPQAQVPSSYGGAGGTSLQRGDQLRNSYGQQNFSRSRSSDAQQHSVTFAQVPAQMSSRPVSAPAPAHMQAYFQAQDRRQSQGQGHGQSQSQEHLDGQGHSYTSHHRESPMGQSSSTQGHLDESSSSQQSRLSQEQTLSKNLQIQTSTDNNYGKVSHSSHSSLSQPSPSSLGSPNYAIGPASKYPDNPGSRPSSARKPSAYTPQSPSNRQNRPKLPLPHQRHESGNRSDYRQSSDNLAGDRKNTTTGFERKQLNEELTASARALSKDRVNTSYNFDELHDRSHDQSHDMSLDFQNHSIFDYEPVSRSESTGSVTPPLPPLSPTNTPPDSAGEEVNSNLPRSISATNVSSAVVDGADDKVNAKRKPRRTSELNFGTERQTRQRKGKKGFKMKGANLHDVRESGTDTESNLSFDIDDTILTVESHDTEHHPAGDLLSSREVITLRNQLHDLETKYNSLQNKVTTDRPVGHPLHAHLSGKGTSLGPPPIGRQRRWSIGSSDTSSFRREAKYKPGKQTHHKHHSKEFKNINKRFQRLESHVVTLARSVAHLSSELRTHNTMVNDLEAVKRELRELRDNPSHPFPNMIDRTFAEQEKFRDWVPSLTNPKRVNKLTKFFGTEPPLLELFLKKLGYEKYAPNFQSEHIGMIELPYMTEDRLEKIGVPMGPRIRILQEAQCCFRHENINVYLV